MTLVRFMKTAAAVAMFLSAGAVIPTVALGAGSAKPDGLIQYALNCYPNPTTCRAPNPPKPYVGGNIYNSTGLSQTVTLKYYSTSPAGSWVVLYIKIQNDGTAAGRFSVRAPATGTKVKYFDNSGSNVTSAITGGSYRTASIAPGGLAYISVEVHKLDTLIGMARLVTITSVTDATRKDAVKFSVKAGGSCGC